MAAAMTLETDVVEHEKVLEKAAEWKAAGK